MKIRKNISLKDKNWFQTGGKAKFYCEPKTYDDFVNSLEFGQNNGLKVNILGKGANVLISDNGFDGLIIHPKINFISKYNRNNNLLTVGSGASIQDAIDWSLNKNLTGLEEFSGIPGTIGGAVYIDLHYFNFRLSDLLIKAEIIDKKTLEIKTVEKSWFDFGYNQSKLQEKKYYLLSATFNLKQVNNYKKYYSMGRRDEIIRQRSSRYPTSHTCGSFFRNFHDHELNSTNNLKFIAYYLDKIGIKGALSHGDAIVSYKHANMIVNRGNAKSSDIINLARKIQELVFEKFGLIPVAECQFIGFDTYPLITKTSPEINLKSFFNNQEAINSSKR